MQALKGRGAHHIGLCGVLQFENGPLGRCNRVFHRSVEKPSFIPSLSKRWIGYHTFSTSGSRRTWLQPRNFVTSSIPFHPGLTFLRASEQSEKGSPHSCATFSIPFFSHLLFPWVLMTDLALSSWLSQDLSLKGSLEATPVSLTHCFPPIGVTGFLTTGLPTWVFSLPAPPSWLFSLTNQITQIVMLEWWGWVIWICFIFFLSVSSKQLI